MNFKEISITQLEPKHSTGDSADNRIRKSWAIQMPDDVKNKFSHLPAQVKLQLYKSFDTAVNEIWISLLKEANLEAEKSGAKRINTGTGIHFEPSHCKDSNELLIKAAQLFIIDFAKTEMKG